MTDVLRLPRSDGANIVHLHVNIWKDLGEREKEIRSCLDVNRKHFDSVSEHGDDKMFNGAEWCHMGRAKFSHMLMHGTYVQSNKILHDKFAGYIVVIANADIEFPAETVEVLRHVNMGDHAFALSRHNPTPDGLELQWQPRGSQDCWVMQRPLKPVEADFPMGVLGCDNRFAAELERAGYIVSNPCLTLKTIHRHAQSTTVWTGDKDKDEKLRERARAGLPRVPRPYKLVDPCRLELA